MKIETLLFKEVVIFPELFMGISLLYLVLHCTFLSIQKKYPLIQTSVLYLGVLVLLFSLFLIFNEPLTVLEASCLNNTFILDYTSFLSKLIIGSLSLFCLLMMHSYIITNKINDFEYILLILFSVLGLFLLCSSNDFLTSYLAIELQSLSFYVLAAFKKNSTFSVEAGLKYFISGAFASSLFLFGSSLVYGITGSIYFDDYILLFNGAYPGFPYNGDVISDELIESIDIDMLVSESRSWLFSSSWFLEYVTDLCYSGDKRDPREISILIGAVTLDRVFVSDLVCILYVEEVEEILQEVTMYEIFCFITTPVSEINFLKFALIFILIGLFFKLTVAPFHIWAPDVYEGSPSSSSFFFSVVPKLAIFVLLLRVCYYSFHGLLDSWRHFIVLIVVLSIIVGSFGGLEQRKLKTLLVYSTISHMGYSLIAFSAGTFESVQMLICYLIIYSLSGLCVWSIFLIIRLKNNYFQKQNKDLTDLVLLGKSNYMIAIFFTTVLFSVAGFPPMIGFLVKLGVFLTAIESSQYFVALISILCSVVGTFYYIRLIKILYFEKLLVGKLYYPINTQNSIVITCLFFFVIFLFINPTLLFLLSYKFSLLLF